MATVWESVEERERRIRGSRTTSVMSRESQDAAQPKTLQEASAPQPFIDRADLRRLAARQYGRPVITLYLNFSADRVVRADRPVFLSFFNSLRHAALEQSRGYLDGLPHEQRLAPEADLREIQQFLDAFEPQGARSLVIFKSGEELNRVIPLPVRVADHLTIEPDPYIEPLEAIVEEQHRVLVLDVAKDKTALSVYQLGYEYVVGRIVEDLPRESHEAFREGKTERHRATHVVWHLKNSAQAAQRVFADARCDLVILAGEEPVINEFEDYLPKALAQRIAGRVELSPDAGPNERRAALDRTLDRWLANEEQTALADLGMYRDRQRLASGLAQVINAGNLFLTRQLFVRSDLSGSGFFCRNHHFLSLEDGRCPFDSRPLEHTDGLIDELIEMSRLHGADVMIVSRHAELLEPYEGIAAVLVAPTPVEELRTVQLTGGA